MKLGNITLRLGVAGGKRGRLALPGCRSCMGTASTTEVRHWQYLAVSRQSLRVGTLGLGAAGCTWSTCHCARCTAPHSGTGLRLEAAVLGTYQFPSLLGDGTDVHWVAFNHIEESYLRDCNCADHMNPPERSGQGYKSSSGSRLAKRPVRLGAGRVVEGSGQVSFTGQSGHTPVFCGPL